MTARVLASALIIATFGFARADDAADYSNLAASARTLDASAYASLGVHICGSGVTAAHNVLAIEAAGMQGRGSLHRLGVDGP